MAKDSGDPHPVGEMQDEHTWSKTIWIPQIEDSFLVDEEGLTKELAVEKRAADDGQRNLPKRTDKTLNEIQMKICGRIFSGILLLNQFLAAELGKAVNAAKKRVASVASAERIQNVISNQVQNTFAEHRARLVELRYEDLSKRRDLRHFRFNNKLRRGAHYKTSLEMTFAILAAMFVGESILNGSLLSEVMSQGLVGGALLAGVISGINIMLGIAAGLWGWRNLNHQNITNRLIGGSLMLICHGFALTWNIFVAHFREVAEIMSAQDNFNFEMAHLGAATVEHFQTHGVLGMGSIQSWALLLLGIFIHFFAAKEGWDDIADRYPDYKKFDLLSKKATAAFDDALAELRDDIRTAVEVVEAEINAKAAEAQNNVRVIDALIGQAKERCQEVANSEDEWVVTGSRLLKLYRDTNKQIRDENSAPDYFDTYPSALDYRRRSFGGGVDRSDEVDSKRALIEDAMAKLAATREAAVEAARAAGEASSSVHKHISACIRKLDKQIADEEAEATGAATRRIEEEDALHHEIEETQ
jgi:hypothetical protein